VTSAPNSCGVTITKATGDTCVLSIRMPSGKRCIAQEVLHSVNREDFTVSNLKIGLGVLTWVSHLSSA
jgi:hypothetical protein